MGAGIAQSFAGIGSSVVVVESGAEAAAAALDRIAAGLKRAAERGKLTEPAADVLGRVSAVPSVDGLPADADLVVEAVPENPALKARLLAAAEQAVGERTVLASGEDEDARGIRLQFRKDLVQLADHLAVDGVAPLGTREPHLDAVARPRDRERSRSAHAAGQS
jgi:hypothetical protein